MTLRTITFDDEQWQVVPREPNEAMVRAGLEASLTANKYLAMLDAAPEPPASMLTQRKLIRAINALGIDSRAGTPDYVLSDAIWAYLHGIPAKSLPAQPRRPYGTDTMSEYGVIPECDGPKPPAQQPPEPAAYMYQHDETGRTTFREPHERMNERRWQEFPLYRHPASEQQPMTEEEIETLMLTTPDDLFEWVRAVERHHGIGKGESNEG